MQQLLDHAVELESASTTAQSPPSPREFGFVFVQLQRIVWQYPLRWLGAYHLDASGSVAMLSGVLSQLARAS